MISSFRSYYACTIYAHSICMDVLTMSNVMLALINSILISALYMRFLLPFHGSKLKSFVSLPWGHGVDYLMHLYIYE